MALRFDPATPLQRTPPFVRWTLVRACSLREFHDYTDPDEMDRLLRAARTYSNAIAEGRVRRGIVVERDWQTSAQPCGFSVDAALAPLGGAEILKQLCSECPANALRVQEATALAGCVGYIVPPSDGEFHVRFDHLAAEQRLEDLFPTTRPRWAGLWINATPTRAELEVQRVVLSKLMEDLPGLVELTDYQLAIEAALANDIPLVVRAHPGGYCQQRRWYVESHCGRCKSPWPQARRQQCAACDHVGGRQPEQSRLRMGTRPYRLLRDFLPAEEIQSLLEGRSDTTD